MRATINEPLGTGRRPRRRKVRKGVPLQRCQARRSQRDHNFEGGMDQPSTTEPLDRSVLCRVDFDAKMHVNAHVMGISGSVAFWKEASRSR